jgi:peptidyl-prolyl cis-trans isomerase D
MISWIQHHLIRHGRWIFLTLLTVIIVAFVFTIGNTPGCTTDRTRYEENLFYGIDLNSPLQRDAYIEKASLSAFLNGQQQMRGGEVETRIAMLHLADEVGVPAPDEATLAEYVRSKNAFLGPDGEFSADAYTRFLDQLETNPRSKQNLVSVLEEDYRIDQVAKALSGPGYLLPSEASAQAQQSRTTFTLVTAGLAYANFEPELEPDEATLKAYYDANKQGYEIPERVQASYVLFESKRFGDNAVEVSEAELRDHFAANRAAFVTEYKAANPTPKPAEGEEAPAPEVVSFEKVRDAVAKSLADEQASDAAHRAAQAFIEKLYLKQITLDSATFNQLLNDSELSLIEIEPYTQSGARQRALSPAMLESAFTLVGNRYYSDAYELDDGYGILILQDRIAPVIPPFEDVAAEVASDYKTDEKRRLFNEKGESLKAELEAALAEDKAFAETAESLGLKVNSFESFEGNDAPADLNRSALRQAQTLDAGEISPMLTLEGVGTFVYVQSKDVPELDEEDPDLAQTKSMLERWASFTTRSDLTNELIMRGLPEGAAEETSE